jgi:hypothetical protein
MTLVKGEPTETRIAAATRKLKGVTLQVSLGSGRQ